MLAYMRIGDEKLVSRRPSAFAQQVYVIGPETGPRKIGVTNDPERRLAVLTSQHKVWLRIHFVHSRRFNDAMEIEKLTHVMLADHLIEDEWFDVTTERAVEAIEEATAAYDRGERVIPTRKDPKYQGRIVGVSCTPDLLSLIDDWRAAQVEHSHKIPSRAEALRLLAEATLDADPPPRRVTHVRSPEPPR